MTRLWPEEAERSVLGAILIAACWAVDAGHRAVRRVQAVGLDAEHFWLQSNGELYRTLVRMADNGLPVDPVSVAAELDTEFADPHVVSRLYVLAHEVVAVDACERHARIVIHAALRREIEWSSA